MNFLPMILGALVDVGKGYFADWQAARAGQRQINAAVVQNKIRLAESAQTHNQEWEMAALQGKDNILRRVSFLLWVWPLVWGYFSPESLQSYFVTLRDVMPDWYIQGFLGMNAAIWGLSSLKDLRASFVRIKPEQAPAPVADAVPVMNQAAP